MKRNADINLLNLFQPQKRVNSQSQIALQGVNTRQKPSPLSLFPEIDPFRKSVLYPLYNSYDSKEEREDDFEEWKMKVDEHFQNLLGQKGNMTPDLISSTKTLIELYPDQRERIEKYIDMKEKKKQESWDQAKSSLNTSLNEQPQAKPILNIIPNEQPNATEAYHQLVVQPRERAMDIREQDEHALKVQQKWFKEERKELLKNIRKYKKEFKDKTNPHLPPEWQMDSILNMIRDDIEYRVPKEVYDRMSEDERFAYDATMGNVYLKKVFPEEKETIFKRFLLTFMLLTAEHSGMYPHLNRLVTPGELTSGVSTAKTTLLTSQVRDLISGRDRNAKAKQRRLEKTLYPFNPQAAKRLKEFDETSKLPDDVVQQYTVPTPFEEEEEEEVITRDDEQMLSDIHGELAALEESRVKDGELYDNFLQYIRDELAAVEEGDKASQQNFDDIASQIESKAEDKAIPKVVRNIYSSIGRLYHSLFPKETKETEEAKTTMKDVELDLSTKEERKEREEIVKEILKQRDGMRDSVIKNRQYLLGQPYLDLISRIGKYDEKHPQDKLEPFLDLQFKEVMKQIDDDREFATYLPSFAEKFNQALKLFQIYYHNAPDDPQKRQSWLDSMQHAYSLMENYFYYIQKYSTLYFGEDVSARDAVVNTYQKVWDRVVDRWDDVIRDSVVNLPSKIKRGEYDMGLWL